MSHDRGCPCGKESYEYEDCVKPDCYKAWTRKEKEQNGTHPNS